MFRHRIIIIFCLIGICMNWQAVRANEALSDSELYATAAVLMDGSSGRVLYGKEEEKMLPMASTTKIMTCILALEYGDMNMECTVSSRAARAPKVKLGALEGRVFLLEDLLYSLMLESHNDTAIVIAESVAGSVEGFAVLMNQKAKEIGLSRTSFVTPNGLDADGHYTTAKDLALLLRYCISESPKSQQFLTITGRQSYTFSDVNGKVCYTVNNHNAFLTMMDGALTGKTGFTGKAGYCYVGALERDGKLLIVSLLACGWPDNRNYKWHDTKILMNYGLKMYEINEYKIETGLPQKILVENGMYDWENGETGAFLEIETDCPDLVRYLTGADEIPEVRLQLKESLAAPVKEGEEAGTIQIWIKNTCMGIYPVYVTDTVRSIDWKWYFRQVAQIFLKLKGTI